MTTAHADYRRHVPLHARETTGGLPIPKYPSSSDMSSTSSTFDLGSEQEEGQYMSLRILDQHKNNSNLMSIWSEGEYEKLQSAQSEDDTSSASSSRRASALPEQLQQLENLYQRRRQGTAAIPQIDELHSTGSSNNMAADPADDTTASVRNISSSGAPSVDDDDDSGEPQHHALPTQPQEDISVRGWTVTGRMDILGGRVVLRDEHGTMLAVVVREELAYTILGVTPVYPNQPRHSLKVDKKRSLYKWATVNKRGRNAFWKRGSYTIVREDDKTCYTTKECGSRFGPRKLKVLKDGNTCGLIEQSFTNGVLTSSEWKIQVGTDIGPRAMVCFLSIINKSMGRLL